MVSETDKFTYRVTWSEEDGEFVGICAEFPSLLRPDNTVESSWFESRLKCTAAWLHKLLNPVLA